MPSSLLCFLFRFLSSAALVISLLTLHLSAAHAATQILHDAGQTLAKMERQLKNPRNRAYATLQKAQVFEQLFQYQTAMELYEQAIDEARKNGRAKNRDTVLPEAERGLTQVMEKYFRSIEEGQYDLYVVTEPGTLYYDTPNPAG